MTDWERHKLTEEQSILLHKGAADAPLGMTLALFEDGVPHPRINGLVEGGIAFDSRQLRRRDVIVEINGVSVANDTQAADVLRSAGCDVTLLVRRDPSLVPEAQLIRKQESIAATAEMAAISLDGRPAPVVAAVASSASTDSVPLQSEVSAQTEIANSAGSALLQGDLEKQSPAFPYRWQHRTVTVDATKIIYTSGSGEAKSIALSDVKAVVVPEPDKNDFEVQMEGRTYIFRAPDFMELGKWVKGLEKLRERAMLGSSAAPPNPVDPSVTSKAN